MMVPYVFVSVLLLLVQQVASEFDNNFDCDSITKASSDQEATLLVTAFFDKVQDGVAYLDDDCVHNAVKRNYFDAATEMIKLYFVKDPKRSTKAESTVRNAI